MLTITQVMRIRGGKMITITREHYRNVLDLIRHHYRARRVPDQQIPVLLALNVNKIYLDRLESFLEDEINLLEFYAFASGKSSENVRRRVGYPMANNTFQFILDALEGSNHNEGPRVTAEIKFPPATQPLVNP